MRREGRAAASDLQLWPVSDLHCGRSLTEPRGRTGRSPGCAGDLRSGRRRGRETRASAVPGGNGVCRCVGGSVSKGDVAMMRVCSLFVVWILFLGARGCRWNRHRDMLGR